MLLSLAEFDEYLKIIAQTLKASFIFFFNQI